MATHRKKRDTRNYIIGTILFVIVGGLVVALAYNFFANRPPAMDSASMCPLDQKLIPGHTIFLVDKTDRLSPAQRDAIETDFLREISRLPENHQVSIFAISDDLEQGRSPVLRRCRPKQFVEGRDNKYTTSQDMTRRIDQQKFVEPFRNILKELISGESLNASPIFEMLQLVKIDGFDRHPIRENGQSKLIIYSDLLHNTEGFSMFQAKPSVSRLAQSSYGQKVLPSLRGVVVRLNILMNRPELQNTQFLNFWRELIALQQGKVEEVIRFPG